MSLELLLPHLASGEVALPNEKLNGKRHDCVHMHKDAPLKINYIYKNAGLLNMILKIMIKYSLKYKYPPKNPTDSDSFDAKLQI